MSTKPIPLAVNVAGIPEALKAERRWVCWRYEQRAEDRWAKILCTTTGYHAKSNDPGTWTSFDDALAAYRTSGFDGVGFCLGDGWAGIDFDDCRNAESGYSMLDVTRYEAYIEVSPSGTGHKLIGRANRIGGEVTMTDFVTWRGARFFAITGVEGHGDPTVDLTELIDGLFPLTAPSAQSWSPRPDTPSYIRQGDTRGTEFIDEGDIYARLTDDEVLLHAATAKNGEKFLKLFRGDASEYGNDLSRADQALVTMLAYWCAGDRDQIDWLFRQSNLMRDKWETRSYRDATLTKAVQR